MKTSAPWASMFSLDGFHKGKLPYRTEFGIGLFEIGLDASGGTVRETEWVELVADAVRGDLADSNQSLKISTQVKLPYGYEIRTYGKEPETEAISFETDFIVTEEYPDGSWKPRVVVEAKVAH